VDRLVFRTLPEDASRAAELETGGIDLDIDVSPQHIGRLEGRGVKITSIPRLSSNHIGFNVEKDVFKDARVRKAVAHAVNREQIVQFVMKGQADVAHGFLHPLVPGATPKEQMRPFMYESSPEKSKRLLTEAGWTPGPSGVRQKDGKPLSAACYVFTEQHERLVTPVQATLRDVGFDMQIKRLEAAAFGTATRAGEHDMRFLPMIYSSADFLYFFVSAAIPTPNTVRWRDDRTDSLFQVSQTTLKEPERIKAFQGIEQRLVGEAVVVPIQHVRWIFGSRARARGLKYHPIHGVYKLMDAWVA
jgi:peptide/nickel transport system substrate-binding protein